MVIWWKWRMGVSKAPQNSLKGRRCRMVALNHDSPKSTHEEKCLWESCVQSSYSQTISVILIAVPKVGNKIEIREWMSLICNLRQCGHQKWFWTLQHCVVRERWLCYHSFHTSLSKEKQIQEPGPLSQKQDLKRGPGKLLWTKIIDALVNGNIWDILRTLTFCA